MTLAGGRASDDDTVRAPCAGGSGRASRGRRSSLPALLALAGAALLLSLPAPGQDYTFTLLAGSRGGRGAFDGPAGDARFRDPSAIAVDGAGNVYLADTLNNTIRKLDAKAGVVSTLAGLAGSKGSRDGLGGAARFWEPRGLAVSPTGIAYVADTANNTIRKVTPTGEVSTFAGKAGYNGSTDGSGADARFAGPSSLALDSSGNLYVADTYGYTVRKISPGGSVTTLAGSPGVSGCTEGVGSAARFSSPQGIAVDLAGNVYVGNTGCYTVSKVTPQGAVTTLAGLAYQFGDADGVGSAARFREPQGVAVDGAGNVFVADAFNETIRRITPAGAVSTVAGLVRTAGAADGSGAAARFNYPVGIATDGSGNVYVADTMNQTARKISPTLVVSTLAGLAPVSGSADGQGASAQFTFPSGIAADASGNVYVADMDANTIRKITPEGLVTTLAGLAGSSGHVDGTGSAARFFHPADVTVDRSGNVYVADTGSNHCVRKVTPAGVVTTLAGQPGSPGSADGTGSAARFRGPQGLTVDGSGVVYVADTFNSAIRRVTPGGEVTTLAGLAAEYGNVGCDDGTGSQARFFRPLGVTVDGQGTVYVADTSNQTIRKVTPGGQVTTLAGSCPSVGSQDGVGAAARFWHPAGVNAAIPGTVLLADTENCTIRKITSEGTVTTIAGSPDWSQRGNVDATGKAARFDYPFGVAVDSSGNLYVADGSNLAIRKGTPSLPDTATIDSATGVPGHPRRLDSFPRTATTWTWRQTRIPAGSTARVSSTSVRDPVFVPDVPDVYQFQLTAEDGAGGKSITFVDLGVSGDGASTFFVPVVLSANGLNNAVFSSELTLTNRGEAPATVRYSYTATEGGGTGTFTDTQPLGPGRQLVIGDAIEFLRSKGLSINAGGSRIGTLSVSLGGVDPTDSSVTVRTTTPVPGPPNPPVGRAGLAYPGVLPGELLGGTAYLFGLRESDSDRSNIALQNGGDATVLLRVTLVSGDGSAPPVLQDVSLFPGSFRQLSVSSLAGGARPQQGFFAKVERMSGTGPYYAYAVVNDNPTSDGSFVEPSTLPTSGPSGLTLPVVVETPVYSTEVVLGNLGSSARTVRLTFSSAAIPGGSASIDLALPAQSQRIIPGFVDFLRSSSLPGTLPPGGSYVGPLFVTSPGGDLAGIAVAGRTSNPSPTGSGRLGVFYAAVPSGGAATSTLLVSGLQQNEKSRSNLALVNTGEVDASPSTFRIEVFDGDTGTKAGEIAREVPARRLVQIDGVLPAAAPGVRNGWIRVTRTAGANPFLGYAVVNDGVAPGLGTGDGAFVAGENGP